MFGAGVTRRLLGTLPPQAATPSGANGPGDQHRASIDAARRSQAGRLQAQTMRGGQQRQAATYGRYIQHPALVYFCHIA